MTISPQIVWLSPLRLEDVDGRRVFRLMGDFDVQYGELLLHCPAGMETDGASIPRMLWRVFGSPFTGCHRRAAIPHDGAYRGELVVYRGGQVQRGMGRRPADIMYRDLLASCGVGRIARGLMYRGVRLAGGRNFRGECE